MIKYKYCKLCNKISRYLNALNIFIMPIKMHSKTKIISPFGCTYTDLQNYFSTVPPCLGTSLVSADPWCSCRKKGPPFPFQS